MSDPRRTLHRAVPCADFGAMDAPYRWRSPLPSTPDAYLRAWAELKTRRAQRWIAFFAWAPCALVVDLAIQAVFGEATANAAFFWVGVPFMLIAIGFMARASFFPCPRCEAPFENTWFSRNPFARSCAHCGLRIGTPRGS
jgi:hypothetical protein